jgi:hypothetical protein
VYEPDLLEGRGSGVKRIEAAAEASAPQDCDADCDAPGADASVPGSPSDCKGDPAAAGCRPAADVPERGQADAAVDECPNDPEKLLPGICGCGQPDIDSDADGTNDCEDGCPEDPTKTAVLICGCGIADADADDDGTADCMDACPRDANKTSVGVCGCGASDDDQDDDGTVDCVDMCPEDGSKTSAGICGCGNVDPKTPEHGEAYCTKRWLLHRYSFEGTETFASDRVGRAHATIVAGDAPTVAGAVTLSGDKGPGYSGEAYVALPQSAWPEGDSATFEAWITWKGAAASGGATWQRVFDFGDQRAGIGNTFVSLTPDGMGGVRATFTTGGSEREVFVISSAPLPLNVMKHLAVVVDGSRATLSLYIDGRAQGSVSLPDKLSKITATNRWLGRSNYDVDSTFFGSIHEFRIYGAALTEAQLASSYAAGADYTFAP